jgi:hypothetical protein
MARRKNKFIRFFLAALGYTSGQRSRAAYPPIQDLLADKIGWKPLKLLGWGFSLYRLVARDAERQVFCQGPFAKYICRALVIGGGLVILMALHSYFSVPAAKRAHPLPANDLLLGVLGVGGLLFALNLYLITRQKYFFCKRSGYYWHGQTEPDQLTPLQIERHVDNYIPLNQIHALQVIDKQINKFTQVYELNLILHDGQRISILNQSGDTDLRQDTNRLSQFLNIPVWDCRARATGSRFAHLTWGSW